MVPPSMPSGHPEPVIIDRITRSNRHLWYRLEVIQQPERARACGAGPKSSADRRPVDPPPVVELRIYEGPSLDRAKDITFTYNANFFLFATLEHARVIVRGRVQSPSTATPPVLTGMPVSGMAYLDRPLEAGYFLFPDLSVRHEGRYRLSFNLYEQTKETGDLDQPTEQGQAGTEMPESFDWRMEVKSNPFMVFSAKKFPSLTESTALSRTVAEQGCRVRIRRDVRMRRREGKSAAVSAAAVASSANGDDEYARHRTQTPDAAAAAAANFHRARSISQESMNRIPYGPDPQRRPSRSSEYPSAPSPQHSSAGPSMPPGFAGAGAQGPSSNNHLRFGGQQHSNYSPAPPIPASPTYASHQHQHGHQYPRAHSQSGNSFAPPPPPSQSYYQDRPASSQHYTTAPPSSSYSTPSAGPGPSPRGDSFGAMDYHRRMSTNYTTAPAPVLADDAITGRIEPARHIPPMASAADSKQMTLPSLSELISFPGDRDSKSDLRRASITMGNTNNGSHDKNSHNGSSSNNSSDRVPSLSQLLLPPPGLPPRSQGSNAAKKRSYGQYHNTDYGHDDYDTPAVKNHAREPESSPPVREYSELWWKRADGSVWTAHGEVSQSRA